MRFDDRIVNFGDANVTSDRRRADGDLRPCGDNRHLAACRQCQARFDELVAFAAARCSDDAAARGRRGIHCRPAARSARSHHAAHRAARSSGRSRRIPAPARCRRARRVQRMLGPARRWVAGAAAAGLAAGLFLGFAVDRSSHMRAVDQRDAAVESARSAAARPPPTIRFFIEIDEALVGSRAREMRADLSAIDVMTTPLEIREVSYVRE